VRVRIGFSGINPSGAKRWARASAAAIPLHRVNPNQDGAAIIDWISDGADPGRIDQRI
jgi:NADPH:quinone reductase